ncbi:MAG: flagellin FliC [Nannocystaceae bacterium]|nr:flagellin FliC [Nannocystaceae bacterium]
MTFSMISNATSLGAQKNFMMTQKSLGKSIGRLSSGLRIQSAADDAAGMGISAVMSADIRSVGQAERNANDAISMIQIAEGAMNEQQNIMARLRELAVQSANGALSNNERAFIDVEQTQLVAEMDRISAVSEFNSFNMLGADAGTFSMQVGKDAVAGIDTIDITFAATDSTTLGVNAMDFATAAGAQTALGTIDTAIGQLSTGRANLGASQNRLEITVSNLRVEEENLTSANSRIKDVDVARETAALTRSQIMSQAGTAMLAQANQLPQSALQLLG